MNVNVSHRAPRRSVQNGCVSGDEEFVRVLTTVSIPEGYLAKGRLESEGIRVILKGEAEGPYRMGPVHLFVPAELEVQARLVLDSTTAPPPGGGSSDEDAQGALAEEGNDEP
jgi:hypothetical protein